MGYDMQKRYSSYVLFLLISVLVAALYLGDFTGLKKVQWSIDDLMYSFRGERTSASDIVLVNIDDASLRQIGPWPWSYAVLADLIATCDTASPKTILVNLDLASRVSEDTSGNTAILANQVSWAENIVLTYDVMLAEYSHQRLSKPEFLFKSSIQTDADLGILNEDAALNIRKPFLPSGLICRYTDGLGFTYFEPDSDRRARWVPLVANYDGFYYPSAPLLAAAFQIGLKPADISIKGGQSIRVGSYVIPTDHSGRMFVNYSSPGHTFSQYSAADIIRERVNLSNLKNRLIIIGLTAGFEGETFATPVASRMSRSELFANVIENIIHKNFVRQLDFSVGLNLLILFGVGVFCAVILPRVSLMYRMIVLIVCLFILCNLSVILFTSYNLQVRSLYLGLEFMLFMLVCPLLDESQVGQKFNLRAALSLKTKDPLTTTLAVKAEASITVPVRHLRDMPDTPVAEGQETGSAAAAAGYDETISTGSPRSIRLGSAEPVTATPTAAFQEPSPRAMTPPAAEAPPDLPMPPRPAPTALSDSDRISHLGRYQVVDILGKGAMGTVFRGIDPAINRPVALKTIRLDFVSDQSEMAELRDRLFREAQAAGKLSHPNIVTIYDVGTEGDLQYIAMEYLEGQTLDRLIKKQVRFSYKIIAGIVSQICQGLEYAHDQGIVHRDIKPANIMVLSDYSIKVMDFGIARVDSSSMTRTGIAMGTPNYIAPELLQGKVVDRRCDIFSLGVVIYELLTSRRPFKGENLTSLIYSIINDDPPPPSSINENLPLIFDHIVARALKKNPLDRYQKASEIRMAVADFVDSFGAAKKVTI